LPPRSRRRDGSPEGGSTGERRLTAKHDHLTVAEVQVLLKACTRYRALLPIYLRSCEEELSILDSVIRKLS